MTDSIIVYGKSNCVQCDRTVRKLDELGVAYSYRDITNDDQLKAEVIEYGYLQAPVVVMGEQHWAGFRPDLIEQYA